MRFTKKYFGSILFILFTSTTLPGCGDSGDQNKSEEISSTIEPPQVETVESYVETGDLDSIRQHGKIRLIAPRFDGADALPREGMLVENYQRMAEEFCKSLGLDAEWHFVDGFEQLIPMLESGAGDLVVTNMTDTSQRREKVAFTSPINRVDEVVVGPESVPISSLEELSKIEITVPLGTSFVEALENLNTETDTTIPWNTAPTETSNSDMLEGIANGQYQATVMDSNVAETLLLDYPSLKTGYVLEQSRPVGWAVRKNAELLLDELNRFLVAHFLTRNSYQSTVRDWEDIKNHGRIRMLTLNNPASYFMWRGDLMGFDYELAKQFAEQHNLHLEVVIKNSIPELITALKAGEGDFIAASLTRSADREAKGLQFSQPYLRLTEQLVGLDSAPPIDQPADLAGKRVGVNPDTVFYQRLGDWKASGIDFQLIEFPDILTEELFTYLEEDRFDYMMADSHLVSMEQVYRDDLQVFLDLESDSHISWVMRPQQSALLEQLNAFIEKEYRGLIYNVTFNKYFVNERKVRSLQADRVIGDSQLSPYDDIVRRVADQFGMDWRLITAQMFQESRFDPQAKSFAGALGLMQVMPRTAKEFGYSNLQDPQTGIEAGVAYLNWLADRFPGDIDFHERIYFQLAAYNAGAGHVRDARRLARQEGLNPDRWFDNVEDAMSLLSKPKYYKKARFGYVRGSEPVKYVREIRDRYLAYLNAKM